MSTSKACPICRVITHFIVPSGVWVDDPAVKAAVVQEYKTKLSNIDCRSFAFGDGSCPFGTSCFYRHAFKDGSLDSRKVRVVTGSKEEGVVVRGVQLSDFID
ncbi:MAG: hypothetical protein SGCHY_001908 [Lobulomycetales sp.]